MASLNVRSANVSEMMAQFLETVDECKALTRPRKVLAPLPEAQREVDPSEFKRLDDYINRMKRVFMRTPARQTDLRNRQRPVSNQATRPTEKGRKRALCTDNITKPKRVKVESTVAVIVTEEKERITPSGPNE